MTTTRYHDLSLDDLLEAVHREHPRAEPCLVLELAVRLRNHELLVRSAHATAQAVVLSCEPLDLVGQPARLRCWNNLRVIGGLPVREASPPETGPVVGVRLGEAVV